MTPSLFTGRPRTNSPSCRTSSSTPSSPASATSSVSLASAGLVLLAGAKTWQEDFNRDLEMKLHRAASSQQRRRSQSRLVGIMGCCQNTKQCLGTDMWKGITSLPDAHHKPDIISRPRNERRPIWIDCSNKVKTYSIEQFIAFCLGRSGERTPLSCNTTLFNESYGRERRARSARIIFCS